MIAGAAGDTPARSQDGTDRRHIVPLWKAVSSGEVILPYIPRPERAIDPAKNVAKALDVRTHAKLWDEAIDSVYCRNAGLCDVLSLRVGRNGGRYGRMGGIKTAALWRVIGPLDIRAGQHGRPAPSIQFPNGDGIKPSLPRVPKMPANAYPYSLLGKMPFRAVTPGLLRRKRGPRICRF
jgi:hypothetical protein